MKWSDYFSELIEKYKSGHYWSYLNEYSKVNKNQKWYSNSQFWRYITTYGILPKEFIEEFKDYIDLSKNDHLSEYTEEELTEFRKKKLITSKALKIALMIKNGTYEAYLRKKEQEEIYQPEKFDKRVLKSTIKNTNNKANNKFKSMKMNSKCFNIRRK